MKTLKIYFLLMLLIQTISISAQSVISGKITNNDSSPIVGATILLSNGMDSTYQWCKNCIGKHTPLECKDTLTKLHFFKIISQKKHPPQPVF